MNPTKSRQSILIVDDAMTNILALEELLKVDYDVHHATGSAEGLALCKTLQPDLLLLDVVMPGIDGFEVCVRLKQDPETRDIPVVFVTARGDVTDEAHGLGVGAIDFITKPFSPPIIKARVRNHLELARQRGVLSTLSFIDGLTGVANRRKFEEALETEWRRCGRQEQWLGVIMIDVDLFKLYNDNYGHQAGDIVLKNLAQSMAQSLNRGGDLIARYGGEEFVCLLPDTDMEGVRATTTRLSSAINELNIPHAKSSVAAHVTVSLGGTAAVPHPDFTAAELVSFADRLLYRGKQSGRNQGRVEEFLAAKAHAKMD